MENNMMKLAQLLSADEEVKNKLGKLLEDGASLDEVKTFAAEHGVEIGKVDLKNGPLPDDSLDQISGGAGASQQGTDFPKYGLIKQTYLHHGAQMAMVVGVFYTPISNVQNVIETIETEIAAGDYSYTVDGVHYASPFQDPSCNKKWACFYE